MNSRIRSYSPMKPIKMRMAGIINNLAKRLEPEIEPTAKMNKKAAADAVYPPENMRILGEP